MNSTDLIDDLKEIASRLRQIRADGWNTTITENLQKLERDIRIMIVELEMPL